MKELIIPSKLNEGDTHSNWDLTAAINYLAEQKTLTISLNFIDDNKSAFVVIASYPGNKTKAVAAEGCVYGGAVYAGFLWD